MASLTLRASLTFVAHRDRVLSSLAIVSPACLPSRLPHNARGSCTHHGMKVAYASVYGVLQGSALEVAHHGRILILEEAASMPTVSSPRSGRMKTDKKQPARIDGNECLERYLRDVRHYSVLSRESERALAKQIVESRTQWQEQVLEHPFHNSPVFASTSRIRSGTPRLTSPPPPRGTPTNTSVKTPPPQL